jgi:hypothetical protein
MGVFRCCIIFMAIGFITTANAGENRPQVAKYAKIFKGPEGLKVVLLGIGDPQKEEFLIQYSGINHEWDGKIFKIKRKNVGKGYDYCIIRNEREFYTLISRKRWGGKLNYTAFLPGLGDQHVAYDEEASRSVIPEHFLTEYLKSPNDIACK